ncbi:MAG: class I SAM-dependent methyltransferase [Anaerolineales bacterium]|nr:class I SAM-dependent methyltransferase [Anaerolineales bacterium]
MPDLTTSPPVIDYEGSNYQQSFWEQGGRAYEDRCEETALKRLLPKEGRLMLELGAGAGRNSPRYKGFQKVVLLDYSRTQLQQAKTFLGKSDRYIYVAADLYKMPFVDNLFDGATMIRVLHHMADVPQALGQIHRTLQNKATFILEYANKRNIKAILRYWMKKQSWNPFLTDPVEFVELNYDFHPQYIRDWLSSTGFNVESQLTVSHFRIGIIKKIIPTALLAGVDSVLQKTGNHWQLTPSVFTKSIVQKDSDITAIGFFRCPICGTSIEQHGDTHLDCNPCKSRWMIRDGIYDFKEPEKIQ